MRSRFEILQDVVQERRTEKVIAHIERPIQYLPEDQAHWQAVVTEAVAAAGMAPFHYDRGVDSIPEPWRVRFLNTASCRSVARGLGDWIELKSSNKLPGMLSACGCLLLVTWLPQFRATESFDDSIPVDKRSEIDDEHLAATAAMVQNLLLLLTAAGMGTYWSSGGVLGAREVFMRLGISNVEKLMAAIFVEYPNGAGQALERIRGKNRSLRSKPDQWFFDLKFE